MMFSMAERPNRLAIPCEKLDVSWVVVLRVSVRRDPNNGGNQGRLPGIRQAEMQLRTGSRARLTTRTYSLAKTPLKAAQAPLASARSIHRFPRPDVVEAMAEVSSAAV